MRAVLAFPLVRLVLIVLVFAVLATPIVLAGGRSHGIWVSIAVNWALVAALLIAMLLVERLTTGKGPAAIGFSPRRALPDLVVGVVFGAALFSLVVGELAFAGFYRVVAAHVSWSLGLAVLLLVAGAALEEMLFRGVIFRLIQEWAGTWIALAVSAVLFGLAHAANPGATWVSSIAIAIEAGILLGAAFVVTRDLWLPIGLHFAWNFAEGPLYGSQVSGHVFLKSALDARVAGPAIFTGGSFGPEAGLFAIVTCLIAGLALLAYAASRSLIVPPSWRQRVRLTLS